MGFRTVVVNQYSKLSLENGNLIYKTPQKITKVNLYDVNNIVCETTDICITTALISELISRRIKLVFCNEKHLPAGELSFYHGSHDTSKKVQLQAKWTDSMKSVFWAEIVRQKISNQAANLEKQGIEASSFLKLAKNIKPGDETNREAAAARIYFNVLFGSKFIRGLNDKTNIALDYGYSLILATTSREITKCGYITQLGLNHRNYFNQFNLACDLMEPFRPIIDDIVFRNYNLEFEDLKLKLLMIFGYQYYFSGEKLYIDNLIEKYLKRMFIAIEADNPKNIPEFKFNERI